MHHEGHCGNKHVSWTAIFGGAFAAIGLLFLFNLLSLGLGLTTPTFLNQDMTTLAIPAFIWLFVGGYIILFVAGWVTGKIARHHLEKPCAGFLHGFLAWSLALIISVLVIMPLAPSSSGMLPKNTPLVNIIATENVSAKDKVVIVETQKMQQKVGVATLSTFFIFLAGALGCSFGAYFAMKCRRSDTECYAPKM